MERNSIVLMQNVSMFSSPQWLSDVKKRVLVSCKQKRKECSKEDVIRKGANIFENRSPSFDEVLAFAIQKEWVKILNIKNNRNIVLSPTGYEALERLYTNDYCEDYLMYQKEIDAVMQGHDTLPLNPKHVMASFWRGTSIEVLSETYLKANRVHDSRESYHKFLLDQSGKTLGENDFAFHFMPKLFVPASLVNERVSLTIEGIEVPHNLMLSKPYTNTRYYVAGMDFGKVQTSAGFYPLIKNKEDFPNELNIVLNWKIGNKQTVIHRLQIFFAFGDHAGKLFSSDQHISRSHTLKEFSLTTIYEDSKDIHQNREIQYRYVKNHIEIIEKVTLSPFPMELHSDFYADRNFEKWREKFEKTAG